MLQTDYTIDTETRFKQQPTKYAISHTYNDRVTASPPPKKNWYHLEREFASKQCNDVTLNATVILLNINKVRGY